MISDGMNGSVNRKKAGGEVNTEEGTREHIIECNFSENHIVIDKYENFELQNFHPKKYKFIQLKTEHYGIWMDFRGPVELTTAIFWPDSSKMINQQIVVKLELPHRRSISPFTVYITYHIEPNSTATIRDLIEFGKSISTYYLQLSNDRRIEIIRHFTRIAIGQHRWLANINIYRGLPDDQDQNIFGNIKKLVKFDNSVHVGLDIEFDVNRIKHKIKHMPRALTTNGIHFGDWRGIG